MDELAGNLGYILKLIAAAGALGTAAFGLVDASKALWGGVSRAGFGYVREAVEALLGPRVPGGTVFGHDQILETLRANWMNGVAKAEQKAVAKSLIRLMLTPASAASMADAVGVNAVNLTAAATNIENNTPLTPQNMAALGAHDVKVSAMLDFGYERGDQFYRNSAKIASAVCAILLSIAAKWIKDSTLGGSGLPMAILVGLIATPLAPIAKDLSTSLSTAVKAVGALKR